MPIKESELILNPDGSVYHLNLKPENIAQTIIFVGDPDRVSKITEHFDSIEFSTHKREFKTETGLYKGKRLSVISTGIGADNIDIVINELDALVNINLETREINNDLVSLDIVRIGTSGSLQSDIPVNSFLMSSHGMDINGMLHAYQTEHISHPDIEDAFVAHSDWDKNKSTPVIVEKSNELAEKFKDENVKLHQGITVTANGFYGPQGRVLRLPLRDSELNNKIDSFKFNDFRITNLEMETSAIYGLSKLLGHRAVSLNAIIANRANGTFSENPEKIVNSLIQFSLDKIIA
ncbi:uridine phosphorylase [Algibacter lectus]|uniref:nucleoside phosphorylase n=1 Tax=Algibacter lectus TaxID=221126 RepID=UPI0008E2C08D|nr:nucleoside phosphorylase [Algibacter lectus]SFC25880.1 uridine phosphorylase [Algibacter lectus]